PAATPQVSVPTNIIWPTAIIIGDQGEYGRCAKRAVGALNPGALPQAKLVMAFGQTLAVLCLHEAPVRNIGQRPYITVA
ncbi:MAG: hypothetical protein ACR2NP_14880, partial [Pirellulaceae bacterium]